VDLGSDAVVTREYSTQRPGLKLSVGSFGICHPEGSTGMLCSSVGPDSEDGMPVLRSHVDPRFGRVFQGENRGVVSCAKEPRCYQATAFDGFRLDCVERP